MNTHFVHTAGPNTALVKSGGKNDVRIVIGGRLLAIPIFQRVDRLSLELRTITVHTTRGTTINGVGVDVTSCIQVKIQGWSPSPSAESQAKNSKFHHTHHEKSSLHIDYNAIRLAAQHFIGKKDAEIEDAIQKTIAGHQRAIIGTLTVEELYRDRAAFSKRVLDLCSDDMRNMGLSVVSYTVAEITDENGYIRALGVRQEEKVKRDAAEGKAEHTNQAKIRASKEDAGSYAVQKTQAQRKIDADQVTDLKALEKQRIVDTQRAVMEKAHSIASAEQDAVLFVKRQQAKAKEVEAELLVMKQKVAREKLEKEQKIHINADAQLYKARADAEAIRAVAAAEAEKVRLVGMANAEATEARGMAEMKVLKERNHIWKESGTHGAIMEKIIDVLPQVASAVAQPLSKTEKMVFVSGGGNGNDGPSQLTKNISRIVAEVPETVSALTGYDLTNGLKHLVEGNSKSIIKGAGLGVGSSLASDVIHMGE